MVRCLSLRLDQAELKLFHLSKLFRDGNGNPHRDGDRLRYGDCNMHGPNGDHSMDGDDPRDSATPRDGDGIQNQ